MELRLHLKRAHPPSGWLEHVDSAPEASGTAPSEQRQAFDGWLGLIQALSVAIGEAREAGSGSQWATRGARERETKIDS